MEKAISNKTVLISSAIIVLALILILTLKTCKTAQTSPAVRRLENINDSLYKAIEKNNEIANTLYARIDSLTMQRDTIIQRQEITNEIYRNETYNILSSDAAGSDKQFRTTLQKSDSLLKSGFYTKTYNLRAAANESKLQ